jgi:hypothetical protein
MAPDQYILYWNYTDTDILFEIQVKTTGWVGFGLSPNGGMDGSDVIIAWVDSTGKFNFTDRYIRGRSLLTDTVQNWFPILVVAQNGYVIAKFTRKIKICDTTDQDMDIDPGTPFVIFAYGTAMSNGDIAYHGPTSRGSQTVPLISSLNTKVNLDMTGVQTVDFRVNASLAPYETIYYCQMFQVPNDWLSIKRHIIRVLTF